jgi:Flp pilus assembly protein CpaB
VYWLGPIRYLRWLAAAAVLAVGLYAEFWPEGTVPHPFAARDIDAGQPITAVDWRRVPRNLLRPPDLEGALAATAINAGEPVLPSHVAHTAVPAGWWSIPVAMPFAPPPGTSVQLIDADTGAVATGIVIAEAADDPFAIDPAALVAVAPEDAASFAVAAAAGAVTVLIGGS